MEHFSYNKESKVITLNQITNYNEDDNVRDIDREDWTDMLVLDVKPKPDRELIELGIIFDHNEAAFVGSMITKVYMANLTGNSTQRSKTNVAQSFGAATFECQKSPLILSNVYLASIVTYGVCIHVPYVVCYVQSMVLMYNQLWQLTYIKHPPISTALDTSLILTTTVHHNPVVNYNYPS